MASQRITIDDLKAVKNRVDEERAKYKIHAMLCGGTGCHASGSLTVKDALIKAVSEKGLSNDVKIIETGCNGFCAMGPVMTVYPEGFFYIKLKP